MPSQDGPESGKIVNGHNLKTDPAPASTSNKIGVPAKDVFFVEHGPESASSAGSGVEQPISFRNLTKAERDAFIDGLDDEGRRLLAEIEGRKEQSDIE